MFWSAKFLIRGKTAMNERWSWVVRYVGVIVVALVLAAALGEMALFKTTKFGKTGLNAARLVQFLGYGGALLVLWLLAKRAAVVLLASRDQRANLLQNILLPLATLIVVASAQPVMLLVLGPLMNKAWHQIYSWVSVTAIILSAAWLLVALFTGSSSLTPLFGGRVVRRGARAEP
jgi:hypothetical protein